MQSTNYAAWALSVTGALLAGIVSWTAHQTLKVPLLAQRLDDLEGQVNRQLSEIKDSIARIEKWLMEK